MLFPHIPHASNSSSLSIREVRAGAEHEACSGVTPGVSAPRGSGSRLPAEDSAEERGVEALGGREPSLHLPDRHLVLGGGAEKREAAGHGAEDLVGVRHPPNQAVFVHRQGGNGRAVGLRGDGHWERRRGERRGDRG